MPNISDPVRLVGSEDHIGAVTGIGDSITSNSRFNISRMCS
jgi:hypothetical protein